MDSTESELPEEIFARTVALLEELTAISSPSDDRPGLVRMAERLGEALAERGLATEVRFAIAAGAATPTFDTTEDPGGLPVLIARGASVAEEADRRVTVAEEIPATASQKGPLLLIGHLDTVLPAIAPRRRDGELVATGAVDMKGGLATLLGALDLLAQRGAAPPPGLLLVAVPDEEVGGALSQAAVARFGAAARARWVLEPGEPSRAAGAETLVAGRRGMFHWRLEARGRAAHAGLHYWEGRSALAAAARWCIEAEGLSRHGGGPTVSAARLVAGEAGFVGDLAAAHSLLGSNRQLNVVPDRALAEGEARFLTRSDGDDTARRLASLAVKVGASTGTTLELECGPVIPPVDPRGPQRAWCERAVRLAAARGWSLEIDEQRGGISFPNFLPDPGKLPVLDGLGPVGGGMHTRDEFVDLHSLRRRIVLLADLLQEEARPSGG